MGKRGRKSLTDTPEQRERTHDAESDDEKRNLTGVPPVPAEPLLQQSQMHHPLRRALRHHIPCSSSHSPNSKPPKTPNHNQFLTDYDEIHDEGTSVGESHAQLEKDRSQSAERFPHHARVGDRGVRSSADADVSGEELNGGVR